jgi:hypothetical protein
VHCIHACKIQGFKKLFGRTCQSDWSFTWADDLGLVHPAKW